MDEMNPTEDTVTITVKSSNCDEQQYTLDRKNRVVEDLRKKGLPIGRLMFGEEVINSGYTGEELGIEEGVLHLIMHLIEEGVLHLMCEDIR